MSFGLEVVNAFDEILLTDGFEYWRRTASGMGSSGPVVGPFLASGIASSVYAKGGGYVTPGVDLGLFVIRPVNFSNSLIWVIPSAPNCKGQLDVVVYDSAGAPVSNSYPVVTGLPYYWEYYERYIPGGVGADYGIALYDVNGNDYFSGADMPFTIAQKTVCQAASYPSVSYPWGVDFVVSTQYLPFPHGVVGGMKKYYANPLAGARGTGYPYESLTDGGIIFKDATNWRYNTRYTTYPFSGSNAGDMISTTFIVPMGL